MARTTTSISCGKIRATEIGNILEIKEIRSTLRTFDDDERTVHNMHALCGAPDTIFLTEA